MENISSYMGIAMLAEWSPAMCVAAAFAVYACIHVGAALALRGTRLEMVRIAESILCDPNVSDRDKDRIDHLLDTSMSFKVVALIPIAVVAVIIDCILGRVESEPANDDPRFIKVSLRYFVSVVGSNPLLGVIAVAFILVGGIAVLICARDDEARREHLASWIEAPAFRASAAVG